MAYVPKNQTPSPFQWLGVYQFFCHSVATYDHDEWDYIPKLDIRLENSGTGILFLKWISKFDSNISDQALEYGNTYPSSILYTNIISALSWRFSYFFFSLFLSLVLSNPFCTVLLAEKKRMPVVEHWNTFGLTQRNMHTRILARSYEHIHIQHILTFFVAFA